jgi:hypothetical protein
MVAEKKSNLVTAKFLVWKKEGKVAEFIITPFIIRST